MSWAVRYSATEFSDVPGAFAFAQRQVQLRESGPREAADGIHPSASAGDDRTGQVFDRDRHEGGDRQRENPDEGQLIVLTAD